MDSRYDHSQHEENMYHLWESSGAFSPSPIKKDKKPIKIDNKSGKQPQPFTIIMPPPNANNPLHVGHAMFVSLEDILIRYHRMLGDDTLWLPGTDHAGIETQFLFEKKLKKDGKSRFNFDRETLYNMVWEYVQENSDIAVNQLKRIGASADWKRYKFTLDEDVVKIALETFEKLYAQKLVYRDMRLVNYCTKCGTAFSELEVKHVEQQTKLYYMKYGPFTIATARPESKFRDTALAVNPTDPRYKDWLGKTLDIPGLLGPITVTIIGDEGVDPEFGTGIMKVTPAHDPHDFELGKKYNLPVNPIIDFNGRMDFSWFINQNGLAHRQDITPEENAKYLERAKLYHGKKVIEARAIMVEHLKEEGLLIKVDENYTNSIGTCYRCGTVIEPLPLPQFFIKVKPLVEPVLKALDNKEVVVYGAGHDKILRHWLENLKDWNISRQIVWGIRMPVWYSIKDNPNLSATCLKPGETSTVTGTLAELQNQGLTLDDIKQGLQTLRAPMDATFIISLTSPGDEYIQETDTFDTWFSSSQWPFSTLQALSQKPEFKGDFERFYPTSVMETGYDILPFWVMRMLMMGMFATGKVPFRQVYLHGLVRDQKGQKMSKSKGNVINPLDIIAKYGADALRMALVIRSSAGLDKSVGEADFKAMRNFTNKIWNAARFVGQGRTENGEQKTENSEPSTVNSAGDKEFKKRLSQVVSDITQQLNDLKIGLAAETVYNEFWHWFCDECIEAAKRDEISFTALQEGLETFLKLLHPFVPFVTEAIWQEMTNENGKQITENSEQKTAHQNLLIVSSWPHGQE